VRQKATTIQTASTCTLFDAIINAGPSIIGAMAYIFCTMTQQHMNNDFHDHKTRQSSMQYPFLAGWLIVALYYTINDGQHQFHLVGRPPLMQFIHCCFDGSCWHCDQKQNFHHIEMSILEGTHLCS
jgi:hypothetical protein